MRDKEVISLKNKIFIYYSNKGQVFRYPTGIDPKQQQQPENQKIIQSLVKKLRDIIYTFKLENGVNPSRDFVKSKMKDESIPLNRISREILERYNYNLELYTTQTYNRFLKRMGQESGIFSGEVVLIEQRGSQKQEIRKQKWECLESHTARRTFITRAITKGIPLNVIMGITGHTRIETLSRYMDKYTPTNGYRELLDE